MDEPTPRARMWSRPLAAAAVLVAAIGLIWGLRARDEGRAPSTTGPRPLAPKERTKAHEDGLLLPSGHELRLDRRIAWVQHDDPNEAQEDWGDWAVEDRGEPLRLGAGLTVPPSVPLPREEDEQVFPFDIEDQR